MIDSSAADAAVVGMAGPAVTARSFEAFFAQQHVRLGRALYLLTGSAVEADDLAQEALVRVYERWDRVGQMESPEGYLFRTALNLHRSRLRWLGVRARQLLDMTPTSDPADVVQDRDSIMRALDALPEGQRAAIVLVEWLGMDHEEAASMLGIRPGSLRARLSRGKTAIRELGADDA